MTPETLQKAYQALTTGRPDETLRMLEGGPPALPVLLLRGGALASLERHEEAAEAFEGVLRLEPEQHAAAYNLAVCQQALGRFHAARKTLERVLKAQPGNLDAMLTLSAVLSEIGTGEEREALLQAAIAQAPDDRRFRHNLAYLYYQMERYEEAVGLTEAIAKAHPEDAAAFDLLGTICLTQGKQQNSRPLLEDAVRYFEQALRLDPARMAIRINLGNTLNALHDSARALSLFQELAGAAPDRLDVHQGMGMALLNLGRLAEARTCFEAATACDPEAAESQYQLAVVSLALGDYETGSRKFEWRWRIRKTPRWRSRNAPLWDGGAIPEGRLLIWSEQGLGDELLHYGWAGQLQARGIAVALESDARLVPLLARSFPDAQVFPKDDPRLLDLADSDVAAQCPSGDLLLRTRPWERPPDQAVRYLQSDSVRRAHFAERLAALHSGRKIGISWFSKGSGLGFGKSVPLDRWRATLGGRDALFVNLQYGDSEAEFEAVCRASEAAHYCDPDLDRREDIEGLCALIDSLDLVITVSNVTAHFAGALGKPCWVLLGPDPLWHWGRQGETAPFYASITTLRASELGGWDGVLAAAAERLDGLLSER